MNQTTNTVHQDVEYWLKNIVVGLGLCPFASLPLKEDTIRIAAFLGTDTEELLGFLEQELTKLEKSDTSQIETTLVAVPNCLHDFYEYNVYFDSIDRLIKINQWEGVFQVASFHPNYQFSGTESSDRENLTNRSPYPMFHLLREDSVEAAIKHFPNPEDIPERNIQCMEKLPEKQVSELFYYLFNKR